MAGFDHRQKARQVVQEPNAPHGIDMPVSYMRVLQMIAHDSPLPEVLLQAETAMGHLAAIVASSQDIIVSSDLNGIFLSWNEGAKQLFGYTAEELLGQSVDTILPPDRPEEERELLSRVARGEGIRNHETLRMAKDGRFIDVSLSVSPIRDSKGRVIGASTIARDITEQKVKEKQQQSLYEFAISVNQALSLSELYAKALDAITYSLNADRASILLFDEDGVMRFKAIRGLSADYQRAVEGHSPWKADESDSHEVVIPDIAPACLDSSFKAIVRKEGIQALAFIPLTYGKRLMGKFMIYYNAPRALSNQEIQHARRIAHTLASGIERKRSEESLRVSEEHLRAVVEATPACIKLVAKDGTLLDMNSVGLGSVEARHVEEVKGKCVYDLVAPEFRDAFRAFNERICTGEKGSLEFDIVGLQGRRRSMETHAVPLHEPDGQFRQLAITHDVTERKQAEAALRASEEQLRALANELEHRVEARTHELLLSQEQLRALSTELNLAEQRERKRLAAELHDHLQQLLVLAKLKLGQGKRLAEALPPCAAVIRHVDDVLTEALAYTRTLVAELSPTVLRDHGFAAALKWLADYMKKYDMAVAVTVPDDGPSIPEDQAVLLFQSVRELLMNSWKHAGTGKVSIELTQHEFAVQIEVTDQGKGFRHSSSEISRDVSSKFGLLSIRERMKSIGGTFSIESSPGIGTRALLSLPLLQEHFKQATLIAPVINEVHGDSAPEDNGSVRVLLVDDHAMVRQGLRSVLEGYSDVQIIAEAANGQDAIDLTMQYRPHVVVMDINMPKMNGVDATQHIKRHYPNTIVVGLSVNADGENQLAMKFAGATVLLTKEAAVEQLYSAIQRAVRV